VTTRLGDIANNLMAWLEERLPIENVVAAAKHKVVPVHRHTIWYYMGGMTLFLFFVQVITGILLLLYYRPSPEAAFESVQFIMTKVRFGWLVRSIHSWAANLLIVMLFIHMFSVFFLKAYRKPRELTWYTGVVLMGLMMTFGFTGYLLPWNQLSFFATKVGSGIAGVLPIVGDFGLRFLRGGEYITGGTLTRFFGWHVAILPAITTVVLTIHVVLVQMHGMDIPRSVADEHGGEEKVPKMQFFWNFILRDALGWVVAVGILAALSALYPWELGVKADPFASAAEGIQPEWYFLFMYQALKYIPAIILGMEGEVLGILAFMVGGAAWFAIPAIDRDPRSQTSRIVTAAGVGAVIFIAIMTLLAFLD
jgi:quinol-cytochrome oxidoreductase complex cytochrome b subunit